MDDFFNKPERTKIELKILCPKCGCIVDKLYDVKKPIEGIGKLVEGTVFANFFNKKMSLCINCINNYNSQARKQL